VKWNQNEVEEKIGVEKDQFFFTFGRTSNCDQSLDEDVHEW